MPTVHKVDNIYSFMWYPESYAACLFLPGHLFEVKLHFIAAAAPNPKIWAMKQFYL